MLHLSAQDAFLVTLCCAGLLNFIMLPIMGAISDKVGRLPLLIGVSLLGLVSWLSLDALAGFRAHPLAA